MRNVKNRIRSAAWRKCVALFAASALLLAAFSFQSSFHPDAAAADRPARLSDWKHSGTMVVLTTPEGADLPASAVCEGFPLLVRLHRDYFDFAAARPRGEDLRFATPQGETLPHEVEAWDAARGEASVWVRVPKIVGAARQELKLYWGNPAAKDASDGAAVFNASNGYLAVWHLGETVRDVVGTFPSKDLGTIPAAGIVGGARRFPGGKGIFCGDKLTNLPAGAASHSTEAWFRAEMPNTTIVGWGNEGGGRGSKVRMQLRSPPHVRIDSDFADVKGAAPVPLREWAQVVHTYDKDDGRLYLNGRPDAAAKPRMDVKSPARLWLGGWYHQYDFVGELDEVRISKVARSADWIKLQYENQKPQQTLVGPLVQPGEAFAVSPESISVREGGSVVFEAKAGGAERVYWTLEREGVESVVAVNRFSYTLAAGRTAGDAALKLRFKAVYGDGVKVKEIPVAVREAIPEPRFTLAADAKWDGRRTMEVVPRIENLHDIQAAGGGKLNYRWTLAGPAAIRQVASDRLTLTRAMHSGPLTVTLELDDGGPSVSATATIQVLEPTKDAWVEPPATEDMPETGRFYAAGDADQGALVCRGTLAAPADSVFLRLYADEKLQATKTAKVSDDRRFSLSAPLAPGLVVYRCEFGSVRGREETVLHQAEDLVCGDVFLIQGQSNAVATDVGPVDPEFQSPWIRSFGRAAGDPAAAAFQAWGRAVVRDRKGGKFQIGAWGMELAKRLVEEYKRPICLLNGAVGGTRIDQHQRNPLDPADPLTIYGRLLSRVRNAKLTHCVKGVFWHQGENDQGADGPTGDFGWRTYESYFIDLAGAWKEDYPNLRNYYVFQIWPKSCAMGVDGSDDRLREVQRNLPSRFSNLRVQSTLGVKPPGGCHFPLEGYADIARHIQPLVELDHYGKTFAGPVAAANLRSASFTSAAQDEVALEFDQEVVWSPALASEFRLDGKPGLVASGKAEGPRLLLQLGRRQEARTISYLFGAKWNPDNILMGRNGIAAFTFCEVSIAPAPPRR